MTGRISIRDLAKIANVSRTTVSLALRGSHKISAPVRKRIQQLALQNNYRSHPMLASLMQQIRVKRKIEDEEVIGFITSDLSPEGWKAWGWSLEVWRGASEEANRLGFRLEQFWAGYGAKNSRSLSNVLYHRGIRGLLFAPMPWPHPVFHMAWKEFAAIACTPSTGLKELPVVRSNHINGMIMTLSGLADLGAKSILFLLTEEDDLRLERAWSAGVHNFRRDDTRAEVHLVELSSYAAIDEVSAALKRTKPDVVVTLRSEILSMLETLGRKPGVDLAYANLNINTDSEGKIGGFFQDPEYLGRRAVQFISKSIYDQSIGLPEHPESILVEGRFVDGKSLDPLRRVKAGALSHPKGRSVALPAAP